MITITKEVQVDIDIDAEDIDAEDFLEPLLRKSNVLKILAEINENVDLPTNLRFEVEQIFREYNAYLPRYKGA